MHMAVQSDYGFAYEYTYHDHDYIIRTMNTKHTGTVHLRVFLLQATYKIALSHRKYICKYICVRCKYICDQVAQKVGL